MRRIPYISISNNKLQYLCPKCKGVIPRDLYISLDCCPSCEHPLNKTSKGIMKSYLLLDSDFYNYFIQYIKEGE